MARWYALPSLPNVLHTVHQVVSCIEDLGATLHLYCLLHGLYSHRRSHPLFYILLSHGWSCGQCCSTSIRMLAAAQMPQHTITILLGLVFCIMNPIITPVCLIYFMIITVTEKYNLLYVYTFEYQSGGQASP